LHKEIEQFLRHGDGSTGEQFKNEELIISLGTGYLADIFSRLNDLNTSIHGTAMNMIRSKKGYLPSLINFQSGLVALDRATMLIFHILKFLMEKYRYPFH